jgi:hypothetical protein
MGSLEAAERAIHALFLTELRDLLRVPVLSRRVPKTTERVFI